MIRSRRIAVELRRGEIKESLWMRSVVKPSVFSCVREYAEMSETEKMQRIIASDMNFPISVLDLQQGKCRVYRDISADQSTKYWQHLLISCRKFLYLLLDIYG